MPKDLKFTPFRPDNESDTYSLRDFTDLLLVNAVGPDDGDGYYGKNLDGRMQHCLECPVFSPEGTTNPPPAWATFISWIPK